MAGALPSLRRLRGAPFLLHPLLLGPATGALAGDLSIGWIVGVALSPWSEALGGGRPSSSVAFGSAIGAAAAILLAWQGRLGGFLVEAFAGAALGTWLASVMHRFEASFVRPSPRQRLRGAAIALGALWAAWAVLERWPEGVRAAAPWIAGGAMAIGVGAVLGRRPAVPGAEARTAGGLAVLLVSNYVGPVALLGLPALSLLQRASGGRWIGRAVTIALALLVAGLMVWIPYQLPSHEFARIPGAVEPIGPLARALLLPGAVAMGALASWLRRPTWGLWSLPLLGALLLSGA